MYIHAYIHTYKQTNFNCFRTEKLFVFPHLASFIFRLLAHLSFAESVCKNRKMATPKVGGGGTALNGESVARKRKISAVIGWGNETMRLEQLLVNATLRIRHDKRT